MSFVSETSDIYTLVSGGFVHYILAWRILKNRVAGKHGDADP